MRRLLGLLVLTLLGGALLLPVTPARPRRTGAATPRR